MSKRATFEHRLTGPTGQVNGDLYGHREIVGFGKTPFLTRTTAMRSLGEVIYAVRVGDLIKIGHTTDLADRFRNLQADEVLAFQHGTHADEQALHATLTVHVAQGREYYHPAPEVISVVNGMRERLGLPALEN